MLTGYSCVRVSSRRAHRLCAGALTAILLTAAQAQSAWVSTGTKALTLNNGSVIGAADAATPMHVAVALKLRNAAALETLIQRMSDPTDSLYGTSLTAAQFAATYSPTAAQAQAVEQYLSSNGFTSIQVDANRLFVTADGTARNVETAFNTAITSYTLNGATVFANSADAQVPSSLSGTVLSVLGLNSIAAMRPFLVKATGTPTVPDLNRSVYGPQDFQKAYDIGRTATGSNTSIAIFAEGDLTQVVKDLRQFETLYKLPQVPVTVNLSGIASTDTSGADEWDLDSQSSTGIAGSVKHLYFYVATSLTDSDIAISFNRFVANPVVKAGSASFGECEAFAYLDGSMLADDEVFAEAAAQGQTVFSSTGDVGAFCPVVGANGVPDSGLPMQSYPAASPYVVAVGGTTLFTNTDGSYNNEVAWYAGGGGVSLLETAPFWQSGVVPGAAAGKGMPDIAMDADPNISGANIIVGGSPLVVGGTSLSSPLSLGSWARIESTHGNKLGFASPLFYKLAQGLNTSTPAPPSVVGFHDIIAGTNGAYAATPGWDYTTGIGSFDISAANALLK